MLVPSWAPNIHPLLVHFPIALLLTALVIDLLDAVREHPAWLAPAAGWLYGIGSCAAFAAYLSGQQAAATVAISEATRALVLAHENWALATTAWFALLATMRIAVGLVAPRRRLYRLLLVGAGTLGAVLLWQAAEQGGRLVYEYGVGVATTPGPL